MKLEPFSSWPAPWDGEIQAVFRLAEDFGIKKLRVKTKLGTLRVQEGGGKLMVAVDSADRATQIICPACGGNCPRQKGYDLEVCPAYQDNPAATIEWVDQVKDYTSAIPRSRSTRSKAKVTPTSVAIDELEQFSYPGFFTVASSYAATGEGVVIHILMGYAENAVQLRARTLENIPEYFAKYADFYAQLYVPSELVDLVPPHVKAFVEKPDSVQGSFEYFSRYRLNRS